MIKTILEKEKTTLVHQATRGPLLLVGLAIALIVALVGLRATLAWSYLGGGGLVAVVGMGAAWVWFRQKSMVVIDQDKKEIEEYLGQEKRVFEWAHVAYADVDRVREAEAADESTTLSPSTTPVQSTVPPKPKLNYHPYLQLKAPAERYYLFDHKGSGLGSYREARAVVEAINTALSLTKEERKALNVYQMRTKGESAGPYPYVVLILLLVIAALVLKLYGVY